MIEHKKLKLTALVLLPTLLIGCGATGAPGCNDESVTSLVQQIVRDKIKDDYAKYYSPYAGGMKYQALKDAVANGSEFLAKHLKDVEKDAGNSEIIVSSIRTQSKNDETRKSECVCQLTINRKNALTKKPSTLNADVTYTAQYSDDGENIYVEVFGL